MKHTTEPLRGDALRRAQVMEIAKRNDAAHAACAKQRATKDAKLAREAAQLDKREMKGLRHTGR